MRICIGSGLKLCSHFPCDDLGNPIFAKPIHVHAFDAQQEVMEKTLAFYFAVSTHGCGYVSDEGTTSNETHPEHTETNYDNLDSDLPDPDSQDEAGSKTCNGKIVGDFNSFGRFFIR